MNELIVGSIKSKSVRLLFAFPDVLMNDYEREIVTWIREYILSYRHIPSVRRLQKKFKNFVSIESSDPLEDIYDREILTKRINATLDHVSEINATMDEGEDPFPIVNKLYGLLKSSGMKTHKYSTFDREKYFTDGPTLSFGIQTLDKQTGGLMRGDLCYFAGRLGSFKTTLMEWFVYQWWKQGNRILLVSNESLASTVFLHMDAITAGFNPLKVRRKENIRELKKLINVSAHIATSSAGEIVVPDERLNSPESVMMLAEQIKADIVIIDGVYLMTPSRKVSQTWERVTEVSRTLKQLAIGTKIPVLGIIQASRKTEQGEKVKIEELAYADALGQDADIVISISSDGDTVATLEFSKNRMGKSAGVGSQIRIDHDTMSFFITENNVDQEYELSDIIGVERSKNGNNGKVTKIL